MPLLSVFSFHSSTSVILWKHAPTISLSVENKSDEEVMSTDCFSYVALRRSQTLTVAPAWSCVRPVPPEATALCAPSLPDKGLISCCAVWPLTRLHPGDRLWFKKKRKEKHRREAGSDTSSVKRRWAALAERQTHSQPLVLKVIHSFLSYIGVIVSEPRLWRWCSRSWWCCIKKGSFPVCYYDVKWAE